MNQFDFYKELYLKELDNKEEINNSLSLPIGLVSGLVAGFFYVITSFYYNYSLACTTFFTIFIGLGLASLCASIYYLVKAYTNFPKDYEYRFLADTNDLSDYYQKLKNFYNQTAPSEKEFEEYILNEMIENTDHNQKSNRKKINFRFKCEKYLIIAFIAICLSLPFFATDYVFKKEKKEPIEVKIVSSKN